MIAVKGEHQEASAAPRRRSRPHVYELDPLRIVTALVVVSVHVMSGTFFVDKTQLALEVQNALVVTAHFTRELFMFVTAFTLVYVYYGKPFALGRFWKRRALGVLLPYSIWSAIYVWFNTHPNDPLTFFRVTLLDILTGRASYQLYYILLTLQFYLILPFFFLFLNYVKRHPWITLGVSFCFQVVLLYLDYHTVQAGTLPDTGIWHYIEKYQDSLVLSYPFYFILGGMAAIYLEQVRAFLRRWGWWTLAALGLALVALWVHFFIQVRYYHEPLARATSVLQPIMVFYSVAVIACFFWLAFCWARRVDASGRPRWHRLWGLLSDSSFGIYLVHALILTYVEAQVVPAMPDAWPAGLRVFLAWLLTAGSATLFTIALMKTPVLSRLVGRERPFPVLQRLRSGVLQWIRSRLPAKAAARVETTSASHEPISAGSIGGPDRGRDEGSLRPAARQHP